jgi:hypothetical protein
LEDAVHVRKATNLRDQIQDLQQDYGKDVVFEALDMLGYDGEDLCDWVHEMGKGRPEELIKKYMSSHPPISPAKARSVPRGYAVEDDPGALAAALTALAAKRGLKAPGEGEQAGPVAPGA